ncbi:methyltransferase domain-containing protein [Glaciibacter flavus]|uniref:Methyltransferase domain-containing protein n=1 Tax=Orlajensenia flava TaxID=2565934 RepID=A0A4S4G0E6_9MICO|nr:methyltransferase domain-containing protein [Glaciibacter flavus]THG36414.1 methyltransferase domain-containing protein [Glaciibacter flavus]
MSSQLTQRDEYTLGHHESVLRTHLWRTAENSAAYLLPSIRPDSRILDLGCGPGTISVDFARIAFAGSVIGMDAETSVVAHARAHAADVGVDNIEFLQGDVYSLPFPDESFDIVHAHQLLQHVARPVDVLKEAFRVLKTDGLMAARDVDYGGVAWYPRLPGLDEWMTVYRAVHVWNGGDPDAGRSLKAWAHAAGFSNVDVTASIWSFASETEREWWGGAWAERVRESTFASHAIESGLANIEALERIRTAWLSWVASPDSTYLMPHGEIIARKASVGHEP